MTYLDFEKICENVTKKGKDYKLGKFIYNSKTHTLTDDKGNIVCKDVEHIDDLEKIIIDEFEPILFYIADIRDRFFRSTVITPNLKDVPGEILKLHKVVARCPNEVLEKANEWEKLDIDSYIKQ